MTTHKGIYPHSQPYVGECYIFLRDGVAYTAIVKIGAMQKLFWAIKVLPRPICDPHNVPIQDGDVFATVDHIDNWFEL